MILTFRLKGQKLFFVIFGDVFCLLTENMLLSTNSSINSD